tara:strand:- start:407 stop:646 length:240 start_codon:yes stop_codon:yes gene_type:complete
MTEKIEIYGQAYCDFCHKARSLCEDRGLPYTYYEVGVDIDVKEFARLFPHKKTVPQIRINGSYLGGFAELNAELTLTGD